MSSTPVKKQKMTLEQFKLKSEWLVYFLPFFIGVLIFTLYPIVNVFLTSFKVDFNYITKEFSGWGLDNYKYVLSDPYFRQPPEESAESNAEFCDQYHLLLRERRAHGSVCGYSENGSHRRSHSNEHRVYSVHHILHVLHEKE